MQLADASWKDFEAEVHAVVAARAYEYDAATIANLMELAARMRAEGRAVPRVDPGYWPTFRLTWEVADADTLEIEIFEDRYEVYRPGPGFDVRYIDHCPGDTFPEDVLLLVPMLAL